MLRTSVLLSTLISAVTGRVMTGAEVGVLLALVRILVRAVSGTTLRLSLKLSGLSRACRFSSRWLMAFGNIWYLRVEE